MTHGQSQGDYARIGPLWVKSGNGITPRVMSVLPLKADIRLREWHVRLVPEADIIDEGRGMLFYRSVARLPVADMVCQSA